jgi:hypothetical protein
VSLKGSQRAPESAKNSVGRLPALSNRCPLNRYWRCRSPMICSKSLIGDTPRTTGEAGTDEGAA